ncbi:uncharacterized protein [Nicotiana tomentosiformis]|uniref:uncharacterized protein n=1 Tax=Nicotiana tomentosiformis TaxID=4098 RepID=UPI00051C8E0D|nr:uncharacterized protein LOC104090822 [Nicotiana tomentosiformis]XP_009594299.1 uncharacterized protein LOC104090822 [Nicotiana tomentosiformis]XP_009594300.1 uncharacterized protein LOC104090822 [Nicotiana tomentosiformis]XP_033510586.1 uncharacterized protein LOC104090822 [Nicotiana tomentosiformis]
MERRPKQSGERKTMENEELVKYMSSLPSYLEKGENLQEKAFSVGVLDWRFLEKWRHEHVKEPCRTSGCSPSTSNTLSFSSMEGSSSNSSRARSCSPARRRIHRPTSQSYYASPPKGSYVQLQNRKPGVIKSPEIEQLVCRIYQSFDEYPQRNMQELGNALHPRRTPHVRRSLDVETKTRTSRSKGKMKIQDRECLSKGDFDDFDCIEKHKSDVLQVPEPGQETNSCTTFCPPDSVVKDQSAVKSSRRSFSCGFISAFYHGQSSSDISSSSTLPHDADESKVGQASPIDAKDSCLSSKTIQPSAYSGNKLSSPPGTNSKQEKKSTVMLKNPTTLNSAESTNVRNSSPTRQFSMAMGRIGQISGIKDMITGSQGVKWPAEQSSPNKTQSSSSIDTGCDKSDTTGRARTSPLRRLLDPLLKPKTGNSDHVKSSTRRGESPTKRSLKVKLDLKSCKSIDIDDPRSNGTFVPSRLQALLQVAVKNGLPLFTFAVDNEVDILAATMKKLNPNLKDYSCWIYTFFTVRETKKKSGNWLNQVEKDRSHGIMPNIVGKMKVSDVPFSELNRQKLDSQFRIREFVLFATDQKASDLHPNDELAAIVVKLPNRTPICPNGSGHQDRNCSNTSTSGLTNPFEDLNMTVILPGGAHSVPSKGEPSSLINRWRSGGSCDCGGWDLGCKLRLLRNHTNHQRISSCSKPKLNAARFELLSQGEARDSKPVFSLSAFKDGIFSVEFSSSLKVLQAFSICIAVLNGRNQESFQMQT